MAAGYLCTHHSPYSSIITVVRRYHCGYSLGLRSTDRHLFAHTSHVTINLAHTAVLCKTHTMSTVRIKSSGADCQAEYATFRQFRLPQWLISGTHRELNAFDIAICVSTTISNGSTSSDIVKWAVKLFHLTIKMKVKSVRCFIFGFVV